MKKIILLSFLFLTIGIIGLILYALKPPKGDRYYLPEKYAGWICVSYNIESAPPLTIEENFLVHRISTNGILKTSSAPRLSPKADEYFYYNKKGIRKATQLKHGGGYSKRAQGQKEHYFYFWVSSGDLDSDYEKYVKTRDINTDPECGTWKKLRY